MLRYPSVCISLSVILLISILTSVESTTSALVHNSPFLPPEDTTLKPGHIKDETKRPSPPSLAYRGFFVIGTTTSLSFHNETTGRRFWLKVGQTDDKSGMRIESISQDFGAVTINLYGHTYYLQMATSDGIPLTMTTAIGGSQIKKLSRNNLVLLNSIGQITKPKFDPKTNSFSNNKKIQKELREFLLKDPASLEVAKFIETNSSAIDFEKLAAIKMPEKAYARDEFNTPGLRKEKLKEINEDLSI